MNEIGDRGISELVPALVKNKTIQYLSLSVSCSFLTFI